MEGTAGLHRTRSKLPLLLIATAGGAVWLAGGAALVHVLIPESAGRAPTLFLNGVAIIFAALVAHIAARDPRLRDHRAKRALTISLILPLAGLLGLAFLLEGPQTFGVSALPMKLVAGSFMFVVYMLVYWMTQRTGGATRQVTG